MKRKLVFALLLLVGVSIMALDLHWQTRVQRSVSGLLTPGSHAALEFIAMQDGARWVAVAPEDLAALVRAYNANRQLLAEQATPRLPFVQATPPAIAPLAKLRIGGAEHEWHLTPRDDRLLKKYLVLSASPEATR
jgi:hypothetical protein